MKRARSLSAKATATTSTPSTGSGPTRVVRQPPPIVFQSSRTSAGQLDSTTPIQIKLKLSRPLRRVFPKLSCPCIGSHLTDVVTTALLRFDGQPLQVASIAENLDDQVLFDYAIPQAWFTYHPLKHGGVLCVDICRRSLPLSSNFAGAAFVFRFAFCVRPAGSDVAPVLEAIDTARFIVGSRQTGETSIPRQSEWVKQAQAQCVRTPQPTAPPIAAIKEDPGAGAGIVSTAGVLDFFPPDDDGIWEGFVL